MHQSHNKKAEPDDLLRVAFRTASVRVPELLRGSVLDPRIGYPPVINKSADIDPCLLGAKRLFARIANSHQKLMPLVVRMKELLSGPGML
jgi:hypothetical protein